MIIMRFLILSALLLLAGAGCVNGGVSVEKAMEVCKDYPEDDMRFEKDPVTGEMVYQSNPSVVTKKECIESVMNGKNPHAD